MSSAVYFGGGEIGIPSSFTMIVVLPVMDCGRMALFLLVARSMMASGSVVVVVVGGRAWPSSESVSSSLSEKTADICCSWCGLSDMCIDRLLLLL